MAKAKQLKLCDPLEVKPDIVMEDRISVLPDELLVHILSYMKLRQAMETSILSRRWRNLWTRIPCLTFDASNMFCRELSYQEQWLKTPQFVRCVDRVLSRLMPPSSSISSFSVYYELLGEGVSHIDQWVLFALEHNVQSLNLFFRNDGALRWLFPPQVVGDKRLCCLRELRLGGCEIVSTSGCFKNLTLVSLASVVVTDEAFRDLLANCLLLQDLFVCSASNLTSIRIPESLVQLKFLHIYLCHDLQTLEVNAANLAIFSYVGAQTNFSFNNVSKLQLLRLGWIDASFSHFMSKNSLLHTLVLEFDLFAEEFDMDYKILPTLTDLKVLSLSVVSLTSGFVGVVNFLRAAPSLYKFELHLKCPNFLTSKSDDEAVTEKFYHKRLREIELSGFSGGKGHIELACSLVESAVELKKITIIPCRIHLNKWHYQKPDREQLDSIRKCTDEISSKLPPGAKLEFRKC